jgi:hypothetical protein
MSFKPYKLAVRLESDPELAMLATLDTALTQTACALLAQHQHVLLADHQDVEPAPETPLTRAADSVISSCWALRAHLRRYRAALARHYRHMPF